MKLIYLLPLLFLAACAHKQTSADQAATPHPCFKAITTKNFEYLKNNLEVCKATKSDSGTTPLMLAAARGHTDLISFMLQNGFDVDEQDFDNGTAINYAMVGNQIDAASLLVLSGADLESKRSDGITVLMGAVQISSFPMIRALTSTHQALNAKADDGWTPIYFALRRRDPEILKYLVRQGACKNVVDIENISPLDFAKEIEWNQGIEILKHSPACGNKSKTPTL